ncbi:MAG TPA: thrombospondin type 3 repeat-containing protein [Polyangiaceae bacterium]|nr:thrombospondin type 3 repeat-containing protein [Polyangiaceae bacterium]
MKIRATVDSFRFSAPTGRVLLAALAGSALLLPRPAAAQTAASLDQKYREGFALETFEPAPAGDRFFAAADASSFTDQRLRLGVVMDYPTRWVLRREDAATGEVKDVVTSQLYLHAGAAYPITRFLHAHVNVPFAASQKGDSAASPTGSHLGDVRLGLRANVIDPDTEGFAFGPGIDVWLPTGNTDNLTGDGRARVNPRLGISGRAGAFVYTANVGYLVRKKIYTESLETGDAVTFGAGAGVVLFGNALQLGPELWGNTQVNKQGTDTKVTPVSALFGAKLRVGDFALGAGVGPGLSTAPGVAPRVVVSIALAPETHVVVETHEEAEATAKPPAEAPKPAVVAPPPPVDGDGDGIPDDKDACPDQLGDRSDDAARNGCPQPKIVDGDGDGVRDEVDACPEQAGPENADPKQTGCPPPKGPADADRDGIPDDKDACPNEAGEASPKAKKNGCPKPAPVVKALAEKPKAVPEDQVAAVTFAGFQVLPNGVSRITVQLSRDAAVDAVVSGTKAEYVLHGTRIPVKNNRNPLLTGHFSAEVVSARLFTVGEGKKRRKHADVASDVHLVALMREAAHPEHRMQRNPDGTATFTVDFPKPSKPPPPEPDPVSPAPKQSAEPSGD